jgi:hypothetical protein
MWMIRAYICFFCDRSSICQAALVVEVGEALGEVALGMPGLGVLLALGFRGGADESLHAHLALHC